MADLEAQVAIGLPSQLLDPGSHARPPPEPVSERARPRSQGNTHAEDDGDAGLTLIDGPTGSNKTKVDIICVPCPGASPLETWARPFVDSLPKLALEDQDPMLGEVAVEASRNPSINRYVPVVSDVWVKQEIRRKVPTAQVLLYKHGALSDGMTLKSLASNLLHHIQLRREAAVGRPRPLFFVAHSVGGLVVKLALNQANETLHHRGILHDCHGVSFFATPHRGSSYLAMKHLGRIVGNLLHLQRPLPQSLAEELHLGNSKLLEMHERFVDLSSEMRVWTFYETLDSPLSGGNVVEEVRFSAPLVSIKSSILGLRQEVVMSLESDHASCASFGPKNETTMAVYLKHVAGAVRKAEDLNDKCRHTPLNLAKTVEVEIIGFYEDPDKEMDAPAAIRLYRTKYSLSQFLTKGPEKCLEERLKHQAPHGLAELREWRVGFSRPERDLKRFTWTHVPFTNPLWAKDVFECLADTYGYDFSRIYNKENWVSGHVAQRHSQYQPSFVKPSCQYHGPEAAPPSRTPRGDSGPCSPGVIPSYMDLYLPYLHFDTYSNMIRRRKLINRRLSHGRSRPVPQNVADLKSLELRMIWQYIGFDPPLRYPKTLDEFGNPSLTDTYARDDDQMLYKLTKETRVPSTTTSTRNLLADDHVDDVSDSGTEEELCDGKVLMVDQIWLWAIDERALLTCFQKRETTPFEGSLFQQADLRSSVYDELNGDLSGRVDTLYDLAGFIAARAVTLLGRNGPDLDIFRIFEEAIGMLTDRMTWNLKRFRMHTFKEMHGDESDDNADENSPMSIKQRYKHELEKAERETRENTSAVLELRDMEDELMTLLKLFEAQDTTLKSMKAIYTRDDLNDVTRNGQVYLDEALVRIDEYKQQCVGMVKRVCSTRMDYEKLLEMAQRKAQVDDVRWSRLHAELAASQKLSVMIFTIFTVIFLPLSFFTSLFGMNTSNDAFSQISLETIGAISLPASTLLVLVTLAGAFSVRVQAAGKWLFRQAARSSKVLGERIATLEPHARRESRAARRSSDRAEVDQRDEDWDFWAFLKKQRGTRHEIPELNRVMPCPAPRRDHQESGASSLARLGLIRFAKTASSSRGMKT